MKASPRILFTLLAIFVVSQAQAMRWYSPNTGRWFSRDPIGEQGGMNLYVFTRNTPLNRIDVLGLAELQWQHNDCQGCNGARLSMNTKNTCEDNPAGKYVSGASGSFSTSCSQNAGDLCDTETHVYVRAGRGLFNCCRKWMVTCEFAYDGNANGDEFIGIHLKGSFLGKPFSYHDGAGNRGGDARIVKSFKLTGTVDVDYWGWTEIARMQPRTRADGSVFHSIDESGSISCSAKCADPKSR